MLWHSWADCGVESVGPDQKWLSTEGFLDKVDQNLKKAMA